MSRGGQFDICTKNGKKIAKKIPAILFSRGRQLVGVHASVRSILINAKKKKPHRKKNSPVSWLLFSHSFCSSGRSPSSGGIAPTAKVQSENAKKNVTERLSIFKWTPTSGRPLTSPKYFYFFFRNSLKLSTSGPIPPELGKLAALETLELQLNQLSGKKQVKIFKSKSLRRS